jgi:lipoate-protein ligase A
LQSWRLIRNEPLSGALNMAIDEVLLDEVAQARSAPVLRLYRWQPAAVSLGYAQKGKGQVNFEACRRHGIDVVRRLTGGRAVLHHREMTYAVIAREDTPPFSSSILDNYRLVADALLAAYTSLEIYCTLEPRRRRTEYAREAANVCFAAPSSYEIVRNGRKLTGSAQKRQSGAFLQHGSLPLEMDLDLLWEVLSPGETKPELRKRGRRVLEESVDWINRLRNVPASVSQVEKALIHAFADGLPFRLKEDCLREHEWARAGNLASAKYADNEG